MLGLSPHSGFTIQWTHHTVESPHSGLMPHVERGLPAATMDNYKPSTACFCVRVNYLFQWNRRPRDTVFHAAREVFNAGIVEENDIIYNSIHYEGKRVQKGKIENNWHESSYRRQRNTAKIGWCFTINIPVASTTLAIPSGWLAGCLRGCSYSNAECLRGIRHIVARVSRKVHPQDQGHQSQYQTSQS